MMNLVSTTYPNLRIHDLGVRFADGAAEVSDEVGKKVLAAKLEGVSEAAPKAKSK